MSSEFFEHANRRFVYSGGDGYNCKNKPVVNQAYHPSGLRKPGLSSRNIYLLRVAKQIEIDSGLSAIAALPPIVIDFFMAGNRRLHHLCTAPVFFLALALNGAEVIGV